VACATGCPMLPLSIRPSGRYAPIAIYGASFATTWGLLGLEARVDRPEVAVAFALQVAVGVLLFRVRQWDRRRWVGILGMLVYLVSVGLLRDGVGLTAGYSSLLLLPVFWASVRSRRAELVCALAGAALLLFAPLVLVGGARYPSSGWRTGALWLVVAAGLGMAVLALVDQLRSSSQRHRLLADNSTDLVSRLSVDGTFIYVSPASQAMIGYEPEELIGRNISEFLHPRDLYGQAARRARVDEAPGALLQEFRVRHRDGRWLWFETAIRAVRDLDGTVIERQGAMRLIEERKRLQETVESQRDEATSLLAEQRALREIATLVAAGVPAAALFGAVAEQLAQLFDGTLGSVVRFDAVTEVGDYVGGWSRYATHLEGQTIDLTGNSATARVYRDGRSAQVLEYGGHATDPFLDRFALGGGFAAPITAGGTLWGAVGVAVAAGRPIPVGAQERLASFAELVAVAISSAEALETLSREATTDPITGLANYRAFYERLGSEVERAARHGRALSVAVLDLDHFKRVNDLHGHQTGDHVLAEVARRLAGAVRSGELMGRIGGEEFAWIMPEATPDGAHAAAERVREAIQDTPFDDVGTLTLSIGVCSNHEAKTADELVGRADEALYWSKAGGRNMTSVYGATERKRHPERQGQPARRREAGAIMS
jgi:diguanylate cyclase (GGDEF)-like protein/PAS domain S-box-containing protein